MKLWLDDQLRDESTPDRWTPSGYVGVQTAREAIRWLKTGGVTFIDFDHDLGERQATGYIVAKFIEKHSYLGTLDPPEWRIHSANPVGAANIQRAMERAHGFRL